MSPRAGLATAPGGPTRGSYRMKWHPFFMKSRLSYLVRLKQAAVEGGGGKESLPTFLPFAPLLISFSFPLLSTFT